MLCSNPATSLFTRCGEAFLLQSPSEYVRVSLSARRTVRPRCAIDVAKDSLHETTAPPRHFARPVVARTTVANGNDHYAGDRLVWVLSAKVLDDLFDLSCTSFSHLCPRWLVWLVVTRGRQPIVHLFQSPVAAMNPKGWQVL